MRGGVPAFQLPARSTATQQTSSSKSCRQEKRQTSSTKPEKVIRPEGCEAMKVEISNTIQTKDAPHDHLLGEPH